MARRLLLLPIAAAAAALLLRCDNITCRTVTTAVSTTCMPDAIDVDREVRIELRELCGRNCARAPSCTATLVSGVVVLDVHEEECNDVSACPGPDGGFIACQQRVVGCKLPPLPQGDYTLRAPGLADELVRVRRGGAAACKLP